MKIPDHLQAQVIYLWNPELGSRTFVSRIKLTTKLTTKATVSIDILVPISLK